MIVSFITVLLNERENLPNAYQQVLEFNDHIPGIDWEYILVDDGSTDGSWEYISALSKKDARVKGIRFTRNFGAISAVMAGLNIATGEYIFDMAADGQEPIELFAQLLQSNLDNGYEISWAVRISRKDSFLSKFFSKMYYKIIRTFAISNFPAEGLDAFCINRRIANFLLENYESTSNMHNLTYWAGFPYGKVYYDRQKRTKGKSKWTFGKKFNLFINSFLSFTYAPLRFVTILGLIFFLIGLIWGGYIILYAFIYGFKIEGFASIMALILLGFGITNLSIGIISEYIWRNFEIAKKKPLYIIREKTFAEINTATPLPVSTRSL